MRPLLQGRRKDQQVNGVFHVQRSQVGGCPEIEVRYWAVLPGATGLYYLRDCAIILRVGNSLPRTRSLQIRSSIFTLCLMFPVLDSSLLWLEDETNYGQVGTRKDSKNIILSNLRPASSLVQSASGASCGSITIATANVKMSCVLRRL